MPPSRERSRTQLGARDIGAVQPTRASHLGPRDDTPRPSSAPAMAAAEGGYARREEIHARREVVGTVKEWATLEELGERWHMNGVRVWDWAHHGYFCNGWIGFLAGGQLSHSFAGGQGTWKRENEGTMIVSFGRCNHTLFLSAEAAVSRSPFFEVTGRSSRDRRPLTNPEDPGTFGYPRGLPKRNQS